MSDLAELLRARHRAIEEQIAHHREQLAACELDLRAICAALGVLDGLTLPAVQPPAVLAVRRGPVAPAAPQVDYAEVARVACAAGEQGLPMGPAVADHFRITRSAADMRIQAARKAGQSIPGGNHRARRPENAPPSPRKGRSVVAVGDKVVIPAVHVPAADPDDEFVAQLVEAATRKVPATFVTEDDAATGTIASDRDVTEGIEHVPPAEQPPRARGATHLECTDCDFGSDNVPELARHCRTQHQRPISEMERRPV